MKKILIFAVILLVAGGAFLTAQPFPYVATTVGVEDDVKDGGSSTIRMTETTRDGMPAWRFQGTIGTSAKDEPYVTFYFVPDDTTKERLRNARNISFKVLPDANRWRIEYRTSSVRDWGYHAYNLRTTPDVVQDINVQQRMFIQPGWATSVPLNPRTAENITFVIDYTAKGQPFDITIWDLKIH